MDRSKRFVLGIGAVALLVATAACDTSYYDHKTVGTVVTAESGRGLGDIEVSCVMPDGYVSDVTYTLPTLGTFELWYDEPCDAILFEDVDGAKNGGVYRAAEIDLEDPDSPIYVQLVLED